MGFPAAFKVGNTVSSILCPAPAIIDLLSTLGLAGLSASAPAPQLGSAGTFEPALPYLMACTQLRHGIRVETTALIQMGACQIRVRRREYRPAEGVTRGT